ncbi:STE/STE11 protein kinase [Thecamonas trahens ATCC 50062]|uniref:STE/STE11 protein kinase n=1 Tax=Thecamonas trahens ATCC 50062 TaxID=461836 RepID=A0A0L0DQC4_THETB|nr:STE/STE11 protein kinase [Thecamonas trahens ATCC 50062]KNC54226.1 STE/STE11 protein kinase [Thecamonas trahens ATCC 50062]|eukprot:XP_013753864.1 STE/STE11 protein kinase [Thecamonas trahens ATCC 50062]
MGCASSRRGKSSNQVRPEGFVTRPVGGGGGSAGNMQRNGTGLSGGSSGFPADGACSVGAPQSWQKGSLLGQGGYGKVYMALNSETGELLAVKEVTLEASSVLSGGSSAALASHVVSLEHEIDMLSRLTHPNIVRYRGTSRDEAALYIFLEYMPCGSIASLLSKFGPLSEGVISKYSRQILMGLDYLHRNSVVHRDIKGSNLLLNTDGAVKLADFGASKTMSKLTTRKAGRRRGDDPTGRTAQLLMGTPQYMAPEAIASPEAFSPKTDVWALGCTVIEMLTARLPWADAGNNAVATMYAVADTKTHPPYPSSVSPLVNSFLRRCFAIKPSSRDTAAELLVHMFITTAPSALSAVPLADLRPGLGTDLSFDVRSGASDAGSTGEFSHVSVPGLSATFVASGQSSPMEALVPRRSSGASANRAVMRLRSPSATRRSLDISPRSRFPPGQSPSGSTTTTTSVHGRAESVVSACEDGMDVLTAVTSSPSLSTLGARAAQQRRGDSRESGDAGMLKGTQSFYTPRAGGAALANVPHPPASRTSRRAMSPPASAVVEYVYSPPQPASPKSGRSDSRVFRYNGGASHESEDDTEPISPLSRAFSPAESRRNRNSSVSRYSPTTPGTSQPVTPVVARTPVSPHIPSRSSQRSSQQTVSNNSIGHRHSPHPRSPHTPHFSPPFKQLTIDVKADEAALPRAVLVSDEFEGGGGRGILSRIASPRSGATTPNGSIRKRRTLSISIQNARLAV